MRIARIGIGLACAGAIAVVATNLPWRASSEAGGGNVPEIATKASATSFEPPRASRPALPMPTGDVSLSRQVQDLVATHDPKNLFLAYGMLADCDEFNREHDRLIFDPELLRKTPKSDNVSGLRGMTEQEKQRDTARCGAMTERERQSRLEYLASAAKAGVPGSAIAFVREGPFGDPSALKTRPDDPLVKEWKALAKAQLAAEADAGTDPAVVNFIAVEYAAGSPTIEQDARLAYRYFLANGLMQSELVGSDSEVAKFFAENSPLMDSIGKDLSQADRATEMAAAQQIASNFRRQRAH